MNYDDALNNAVLKVKHMPAYRLGMWSFTDWVYSNYKMKVEVIHVEGDQAEKDRKWKVLSFKDEGLATMFKLKYG